MKSVVMNCRCGVCRHKWTRTLNDKRYTPIVCKCGVTKVSFRLEK